MGVRRGQNVRGVRRKIQRVPHNNQAISVHKLVTKQACSSIAHHGGTAINLTFESPGGGAFQVIQRQMTDDSDNLKSKKVRFEKTKSFFCSSPVMSAPVLMVTRPPSIRLCSNVIVFSAASKRLINAWFNVNFCHGLFERSV